MQKVNVMTYFILMFMIHLEKKKLTFSVVLDSLLAQRRDFPAKYLQTIFFSLLYVLELCKVG